MQFVFSPVLGVLSDRFGRRPIILASNLGLGLDYIVMALAPTIGWLFLGRVISGITAASISTAHGLHLRCGCAGKTRGRVWDDRRGVRGRLYSRTGARRFARHFRSAAALLGGGRIESGQCALRILCSAGIAAARAAQSSSPCVGRTRSARSCSCVRIRNCSGSRRSNSSATSRTKSLTSGRSTPFSVTPGMKAWSAFPSRWLESVRS